MTKEKLAMYVTVGLAGLWKLRWAVPLAFIAYGLYLYPNMAINFLIGAGIVLGFVIAVGVVSTAVGWILVRTGHAEKVMPACDWEDVDND